MTASTIAALFGTMLVLAIAPGPSDFAVVSRSIASGFTQGLIMIGGIVIADFIFIGLAVYSLAEVAESMSSLFVLVKYACGAYLIWLGVGSLKSQPKVEGVPRTREISGYSSFLGGLLITLGDPKAILFYMGLFPAFVDLSNISIPDTIVIMLTATMVVGGVKISYAYLADKAKLLFENSGIRQKVDRVAGGVLVCTGIFLLLGT